MQQRINFFIILILSGFFIQASCQRELYDVEFETETIDIGTLNSGENKDVVFKFKNTGKETLKIWEIRSTCGCMTTGAWDQEIKPGKKGEININFHTQAFRGDVTKVIYIKTNIPGRASIQLTIKVFIFHILEINPQSVYLGDILDLTQPVTRSFEIINNQGFPLAREQIISPNENTVINLLSLDGDNKYLLEFTVNPPFIKEEEITKKILITTGPTLNQMIELSYSYFVPPPVQVNPKEIKLDLAKVKKETIDWRINIRSNIDQPIRILDLKMDGSGVDFFEVELLKDKFYQVAVVFPLGFTFPEDKSNFTMSFKVRNDPKKLLYTINISAGIPEED